VGRVRDHVIYQGGDVLLLRAAARLAYTARARGCTHIHAQFAQEAAAVAICGARIAGLTASFTAHGQDLGRDDADLALKLAAALETRVEDLFYLLPD